MRLFSIKINSKPQKKKITNNKIKTKERKKDAVRYCKRESKYEIKMIEKKTGRNSVLLLIAKESLNAKDVLIVCVCVWILDW